VDEPRINTPCPSCGSRTLFIGVGGHLTCSLIGCKEPRTGKFIEGLKAQLTAECENVKKLREAMIGLIKLRTETDHTYESAYQAMFKGMGRTEWAAAEQTIADTEGK